MMRALTVALALVPQVSLGFTCANITSLADHFRRVEQSPDDYAIFAGVIDMQPNYETGDGASPDTSVRIYPAQFTGAYLAQSGFVDGYSTPLTLQVCEDYWCHVFPTGSEDIFFFRIENGRYIYEPPVCANFGGATDANLRYLEGCVSDEGCDPNY